MSRTPQEILTAHVTAVMDGDMPGILKNFSEDAVMITPFGVLEGHAGVEQFFSGVLTTMPEPVLTATSATFAADALLLLWTATSPAGTISDGVDTLIFGDDVIRLETTQFTIQPSS